MLKIAAVTRKSDRESIVDILGWIGVITASLMYLSLIHQIYLNLTGFKGSWMLPFVGSISSIIWTSYGYLKTPRDYPIVVCNMIGIPCTIATLVTTFFF